MKKILIAGGTGLVGTRLTELLIERGYHVVILSRNCALNSNEIFQRLKTSSGDQLSCATWDTASQLYEYKVFEDAYAVINLAGANIAEKRWTEERKQEIINSRIASSKLIIKALSETNNKIEVVINASATGWYGDDKQRPTETPFEEQTSAANDFLGTTTRLWEESIQPVQELGKRLVILRTGLVLSNQGGIMPELVKSLNLRVATVFGNGHQIMSWIHIDDLCELYMAALEMEEIQGVYNAVAPFSATNIRMVTALAEQLLKKKFIPLKVPKTILKMALGEMSQELLKSCMVSSKKVLETGFSYQFPRIKDAFEDLVR